MADIIDHRRWLRREGAEIPPVGTGRPDRCQDHLTRNGCDARPQAAEPPGHQADHDVQDAVRGHRCQDLTIDQFRDALHGHPESIVDLAQQEEQHRKQADHGPVALPPKFCIYLIRIISIPAGCKRDRDHHQIDELHDL